MQPVVPAVKKKHPINLVIFAVAIIFVVWAVMSQSKSEASAASKRTEFVTSYLPKEAKFVVTRETYDAYNGSYDISFEITNTGKNKMRYPAFHAEMYQNGSIVGEADGGAASSLKPGATGTGTFHEVFPDRRPDSVIIKKSL